MRKHKLKKAIIIFVLILLIGIGEYTGVLPYVVARITSSIYVVHNYPTSGLKFQDAEYAYGFGDYSVSYEDKDGKTVGFMLFPNEFPIFIRYDSIKGDMLN